MKRLSKDGSAALRISSKKLAITVNQFPGDHDATRFSPIAQLALLPMPTAQPIKPVGGNGRAKPGKVCGKDGKQCVFARWGKKTLLKLSLNDFGTLFALRHHLFCKSTMYS